MQDMTPRQIVAELDRYVIGQAAAKKAIAIAIRNRWRRQRLAPEVAREINPKNIIMMGPTGVGKTEIARRIAVLTQAPFIKVEATKFTEVGYHGRDVESMVRDLLEQAIGMVRSEHSQLVQSRAEEAVEQRLLDLLLPGSPPPRTSGGLPDTDDWQERRQHTRNRLLERLRAGEMEDREVELSISTKAASVAMFSGMGMDQMDPDMSKVFENIIPEKTHKRKLTIREARPILLQQETDALLDREKLTRQAIERTEQSGIIFIDEIDKVASPSGDRGGRGPDVSRQGVQRDLLPIVEGTAITTRHGVVHTDHILFIAAGAFHGSKVGDLMPELQGRFPIRVELEPLTQRDFVRILTEPDNALTKQQSALLGVEGVQITFETAAIEAIAGVAATANQKSENIGARRLMTVMEILFERLSFEAPDLPQDEKRVVVSEAMVADTLGSVVEDEDLSRFVL